MAPTNERARRGGHRTGTTWGGMRRTANTNAGVSRNGTSTARGDTRARYVHRRRARPDRPPTGPRLIDRMSYGGGRGYDRGGTSRPIPRFHQGHDGRAEDDQDGTGGNVQGGEGASAAANDNVDIDMGDHSFANAAINNASSNQSSSTLFYNSQPTQLHTPTPTFTVSLSILPNLNPHHRPRPRQNTSRSSNQIRMINQPVKPDKEAKHPVNTYRGRDPIKRLVQNKKLRAIVAGKQVPKDKRVYKGERMELRLSSGGRVLK